MCGDRNEPCPLNIDINLGATNDIRNIVNTFEKELNEYKNKVIKYKNDLLFGYITSEDAVEKFDDIKENIKINTELFDLYFRLLNNIVDNPKKNDKILNLKKGFYENVDSFKSMIEEFEKSGNTQYVIDAVELYKNEIMPKGEKIMFQSYAYNGVDYNEDDKTYHLDQKKNTIKQFEIDAGFEDHSIISMKMGMPQKMNKTAATKIAPVIEERIPALKKRPKLVIKETEEKE